MTDKAEDVKALLDANITADDVIARLKRIIAMRTGATGQQVFEDLPRDAISIIASQAAEIAALKFVVNEYQAELLVLRGQIDCAKEECRRHDLCWSRGRR